MIVFAETPMAEQAARSLRRAPSQSDCCECGCGELLSAKVRAARYLHAEGFSFAEIGREIGASPKYARAIINGSSTQGAPRFVKGHNAKTAKWRTVECAWCGRSFRTSSRDVVLVCNGREECSLIRWMIHLYGSDQVWDELRKRPVSAWRYLSTDRWRKCETNHARGKPAFADAEFLQEKVLWLEGHASDRLRKLEDKWIAKATRQHARDLAAEEKRRREVQRQVDREERKGEPSLFPASLSLEQPVRTLSHGEVRTLGQTLVGAPDPSHELDRERLWEIVGDMRPEDVARMDDHSLARLQHRLLSEGLVDIKVTKDERERLRDPNPHSGASIPKIGRKHGGKRTRKQQQQVTRTHHVRDLPTHAKRAHKQLRKERRAAA